MCLKNRCFRLFGPIVAVIAVAALIAGGGELLPTAHADLIFSDTFDDGTTGDWYRASTDGPMSELGTLTTSNDWLSWSAGDWDAQQVIGRSFPATEIGVGESIRLTFDYRQSGSVGIFRAALFNVENPISADNWAAGGDAGALEGYYTFVRDDSSSSNDARREAYSSSGSKRHPGQAGTTIGTDSTRYDIDQDGTITYQGLFEVFRISDTQMDTLFTLSSSNPSNPTTHFSVTGTTSTTQDAFNTVAFRSSGGTSLFNNVAVTFIPEPGTWLLLLSAAACGLLVRRRRGKE